MKLRILLLAIGVVALPVAVSADGAATYKSRCAMCHGADGAGQTPAGKSMKVKPLGSDEVQKLTDDEMSKIIADGKGKMPGYKSKLSAEEIGLVVKFVRSFAPVK
jgi:cytochrome c6